MHDLARVIHAMNEVNGSISNTKFDSELEQLEQKALKSLSYLLKLSPSELAIHLGQGEDPTEWMITPPGARTLTEQ